MVARSIVYEMQKTGADKVFLDVTHLPASTVTTRFPTIYRFCLDHGLDITKDRIPVAPAAHYMIGGVRTDHWGATNIAGLFACGETACPGVHGANRLASNSLLDALVFSKRIVDRTIGRTDGQQETDGQYVYHRLPARQGTADSSQAQAVPLSRSCSGTKWASSATARASPRPPRRWLPGRAGCRRRSTGPATSWPA